MGKWGEEFGKSVEKWFEGEESQQLTEEEWEDRQEEIEILREEIQIEKMELAEEQRAELELLREEMEIKREAYRERLNEIRAEERERLQEIREESNSFSFGERLQESLEEGLKNLITETPSFKANQMVYDQLVADGFAKDGKKFSYKLHKQSLSINGKKQPKAIHKKYLKIYEQGLGRSLTDTDRISIKGKMNRADNSFHGSINITDKEEKERRRL